MAARPMASATISFGLVSIPCKLFPTVDNTSAVRFNYLTRTARGCASSISAPPTGDS